MSSISSGVQSTPQQTQQTDFALKKSVNKTEIKDIISQVQTDGKITKEQFKKLASGIEGGKEKLSELLKGVVPEDDLQKLQKFTFKRDGKTTFSVIDPLKRADFESRLGKVLEKLPQAKEDTSFFLLNRVGNNLDKLKYKGDSDSKTGLIETKLTASIGASNAAPDGSPANWALGLTDTDFGMSGSVVARGKMNVKSERLEEPPSSKVKLTFEAKLSAGVEGEGNAKSLGVSAFSAKGGAEIGIVKRVSYEFNSIEDAKKFLESKGKGFVEEGTTGVDPNTKTFKRTSVVEKETSLSIGGDSNLVKVEKTTKPNLLNKLFGNVSLSKQALSETITESKSEGKTKTFSLDTKSGMLVFNKTKTSTQLSVTEKNGKLSGQFSLEIDLNKIINNNDKEALINKLTNRFKTVQSKLPKDIQLDSQSIESYIRGSVEKLLKNDGNKYFSDPKKSSTGTRDLSKMPQSSEVKVSGSVPTGVVNAKFDVSARWGNMIRLSIPLEADPSNPKKLGVVDSDSIIQISNIRGGSVGGGVGVGVGGGAELSATGNIGMNVQKLRRLTIGEKSRPQQPILQVPTPQVQPKDNQSSTTPQVQPAPKVKSTKDENEQSESESQENVQTSPKIEKQQPAPKVNKNESETVEIDFEDI